MEELYGERKIGRHGQALFSRNPGRSLANRSFLDLDTFNSPVRYDRSSVYFQQPAGILSVAALSIPEMETERLNVCRLRCRFPEKTPANTSLTFRTIREFLATPRCPIDDKLEDAGSPVLS